MKIINDKKYATVSELSHLLNLTRQAIYNRINTVWQDYTIKNDNVILIDTAVLTSDELERLEIEKRAEVQHRHRENNIYIVSLKEQIQAQSEHINTLKNENEYLKLQIDKLQDQLKTLQNLLNQQQQLQGQLQQRLLEAPSEDEKQDQEQPPAEAKKGFFKRRKKK